MKTKPPAIRRRCEFCHKTCWQEVVGNDKGYRLQCSRCREVSEFRFKQPTKKRNSSPMSKGIQLGRAAIKKAKGE